MKFIIRWGINAVALWAAVAILPGIDFKGNWTGIVALALIFGLVNALFRPVLKFLTCPLIVLTLGLFTLIINTVLFLFTAWIGNKIGLDLIINNPQFWNAFWGALIVSAVSITLSLILKDELKERHPHKHN